MVTPTPSNANDKAADSTLVGTGTIHVILVMNMKRWINADSVEKFLRLRDSKEYTQCLRAIPKYIDQNKFVQAKDTEDLERIGYDLGVFRAHVLENLFMPTFRLVDDTQPMPILYTSSQENLDSFLECWNEWPIKKIRLSHGGLITVKLEREIENTSLVDLAEMVLGLERFEPSSIVQELKEALEKGNGDQIDLLTSRLRRGVHQIHGVQWEIANEVVRQFFRAIVYDPTYSNEAYRQVLRNHPRLGRENISLRPQVLVLHNQNNPEEDFFINTTEPTGEETHPLRDRYVVFAFSKLAEAAKPDVALPPDQIKVDACHCRNIASLLEGVIVGQKGGKPKFAEYKDRVARNLVTENDIATWQNELCLLTLDNGLVYYYSDHLFPMAQEIYFLHRQVKHEDYWGSIIRGIEHLMEVRVQAQMIAGETAERLVEAAEFTRRLRAPAATGTSGALLLMCPIWRG
jgi:hypothetical protein